MSELINEQYETNYQDLLKLQAELAERLHAIEKDLFRRTEALSPKYAEQATEMENAEVLQELYDEGREELALVKAALERYQANKYGICQHCGAKISAERLQAVPYTDRCRICANDQ